MCTSTSCMVNFVEHTKEKKKKTDSEIMNLKKRPQYFKNKWGEYSNTKLTIIF